jgi:hypothetical protein
MTSKMTHSFAAAAFVLALGGVLVAAPMHAQAQGTTATRAQVKMDRDAFLSMARWDESIGNWVLKDDMAMPAGVASRAEIKAMRDKFLSMNKWNESTSQWVPMTAARDMNKLTRAEVSAETVAFLKSHRYDESTSQYVMKAR